MALKLGVHLIQVYGDSKIVIDWAMGSTRCNILQLSPILEEIFILKSNFDYISFTHVYRERNSIADGLSKEGAQLQEGEQSSKSYLRNPGGYYHQPHKDFLRRIT